MMQGGKGATTHHHRNLGWGFSVGGPLRVFNFPDRMAIVRHHIPLRQFRNRGHCESIITYVESS